MVFSHHYLGWRRLGSLRTVHPTEIAHFYLHRSDRDDHILKPTISKPYPHSHNNHDNQTTSSKQPKASGICYPNIIRPEQENLIDYLRTLDKSGGRAKKIRKEDIAAANAKISRADR